MYLKFIGIDEFKVKGWKTHGMQTLILKSKSVYINVDKVLFREKSTTIKKGVLYT